MLKASYKIIIMIVLLMASAIYILDDLLMVEEEVSVANTISDEYIASLPKESGVFKRGYPNLDFERMPANANRKDLKEYYQNRAYPGAPPVIPHPLLSEMGIGDKSCLQCHQNGGYVAQFKSYAPITPHAAMQNCRQCHVASKTNGKFKASDWSKTAHPAVGQNALPGSPPVIPHSLQMRENCLACHASPATPKQILVSHPERINCRQCHAEKKQTLKVVWESLEDDSKRIEWKELNQ